MSYARLNIWLRDLDCGPKNVWKVELVVKTCGGLYLPDFNPDVIDKLRVSYPNYDIERGNRDNETTIRIEKEKPHDPPVIKHIEVDVPPGCYIVRAWVCWGNLWTDRAMVIVGCGQEACVNLIVPPKERCIRNGIFPVGIAAWEKQNKYPQIINNDNMRNAFGVLMTTIEIKKDELKSEVTDLIKELEESDAEDAPQYVEAFKYIQDLIPDIQIEKE